MRSAGDAVTCAAFAVICYGLYLLYQKAVREHEEKEAARLGKSGSVTGLETDQSSLISSTAVGASGLKSEESSSSSIFN